MDPGGPARFGPYVVESELGRGGMGVVYRARAEADGALVALKVLGEECGPEAAARFQREVRLAAELDHPGIVRCLASGTEGGQAWFAMELIEGRPLDEAITEVEFTWHRAVGIARMAAAAVGAAHARGILHRDLKPSNILLDSAAHPHIADFGLAKDTRTGSKYTRTGQTLGTPAYMSPEQARGELADLTPASDVWSLGCVLYEMLAGRPAFTGDTPAGIVGRVLTATPASLRAGLPGLPRPVVELVMGALDRDPKRRPADGAAYAAECDRVLDGERPVHRGPRSRRLWWAAGAVSVAAAAAAVATVWRPAPAPAPPEPVAADPAEALAERAMRDGVGDPQEGAATLRRALALRPERSDWRVQLGRLEWLAGNAETARTVWSDIAEDDAEYPSARLHLGLVYLFYWDPRGWFKNDQAMFHLRPLQSNTGEAGRLARAAVALVERRPAEVVAELAGDRGWEAALMRGLAAQITDDPTEALRQFDAALAQGVPFHWVRVNRASNLNMLGDHARALEGFDAVLREDPRNVVARASRADVLLRMGRSDEALEEYNAVIAMDSGLGQALVNSLVSRAAILMERGQHDAALADLDAALAKNPDDSRARANRGILYSTVGRLEEALADLQRAAELEPGGADVHANLGVVLKGLGRLPEAEAAYTRAVSLGGERMELYVNRGSVRSAMGDLAGALADLDTAARIDPQSALPLHGRAFALATAGRYAEAFTAVDQALQRKPNWANALWLRGRMHVQHDRLDAGRADYEACLRADPNFDTARVDLSKLLLHLQDYAGVIRECSALIDRRPRSEDGRRLRGRARMLAGKYEEAIEDLSWIIEQNTRLPDVWAGRAACHWARRDFERAYADYARAVALEPRVPGWQFALGRAAGAVGRHREAVAALERFLAAVPSGPDSDTARTLLAHHRSKLR